MRLRGVEKATKKVKTYKRDIMEELTRPIPPPPEDMTIHDLRVRNRELFKILGRMQYDRDAYRNDPNVSSFIYPHLKELEINMARIEELKTEEEKSIPEREACRKAFEKKKKKNEGT